ncbi:MAG: Holliday junction branch migration protein RuvA [Clostridia bacterium]|nr:Holliday junction branch migration protein RuvA [Clostridia bacterium]
MIETLYGKIFEMDAASCGIIIECCGVGYRVTVTANTLSKLPTPKFTPAGDPVEGAPVRLYTYMAVREDGVDLYGFHTREELSMYRLLISVSGIGPKAAMSILSLFTPRSLASAVAANDVKSISRAPGVGPKTAARVALELKDKIARNFPQFSSSDNSGDYIPAAANAPVNNLNDAREALAVLGYSRSEIAAAMKDVDPASPVEDIIKAALGQLMKN